MSSKPGKDQDRFTFQESADQNRQVSIMFDIGLYHRQTLPDRQALRLDNSQPLADPCEIAIEDDPVPI